MEAVSQLISAASELVSKTIGGTPDLASASHSLDKMAAASIVSRSASGEDKRLERIWKASFVLLQAEASEGLSWTSLLPLLHRLDQALRDASAAPDLAAYFVKP